MGDFWASFAIFWALWYFTWVGANALISWVVLSMIDGVSV